MLSKHKFIKLYRKLRRKMYFRYNSESNRKLARKLVKKYIDKYIWNNYKVTEIICDQRNNNSALIDSRRLIVDVYAVKLLCPEKINLTFKV